jgi:hypothetical protein
MISKIDFIDGPIGIAYPLEEFGKLFPEDLEKILHTVGNYWRELCNGKKYDLDNSTLKEIVVLDMYIQLWFWDNSNCPFCVGFPI